MTTRQPVEFTNIRNNRCGNHVTLVDFRGEILSGQKGLPIKKAPETPQNFVYKFLRRTSGPASASGNNIDMNTNSSLVDLSVFEYEVPVDEELTLERLNFQIVDMGMQNERFAGLAMPLTNGCLFEIIDTDGTTQILDFLDGNPIRANADFSSLAGSDSVVSVVAGEGSLPIRFTISKAGRPMFLAAGQQVRWTNQDDLSTVTRFRAMIQGIRVDTSEISTFEA